jgi:peptidoglycan/LPS O-acetylase OafA/YrhL/SAM-dependent methyltransferase
MLLNLQLLRAIAALAVVYYHTTSQAGLNLPVNVGAHGVDLFFVISGFIIARVAVRSPKGFLRRRIIRIVPFYWTATLVVFGLALLSPRVLRSTHADYVQLLCSLLFIPRDTPQAGMVPTLILGWSLNYEMYFYLVFAVALAIVPGLAPLLCGLAVTSIALLINLSGSRDPGVTFYARPIVFEFVYGIGAYYLFTVFERHPGWFRQRREVRYGLWIMSLASVIFIGLEEAHGGFGLPRFIAAGIPAFALVVAALILERAYGDSVRSPIVSMLGDASYVLYLIHPYIVYGLLRTLWAGRARSDWPVSALLVVALAGIATAAAIAIHLGFEKPVTSRLRRCWLAGDDTAAIRASGAAPSQPNTGMKELARSWDLDLLLRTYLFIPRKMLRDVIREFGNLLEGRTLDVGCGRQQYRKFLNCREYLGVDWALASRPPAVADVTRIPFRDRAFDSALCTEVLEHLPEPGRCLDEIRRVVKPGGVVLFTVPMTMYTHSEPHDFYRYTEFGLRYLLEKHGFDVVTLRRLGGVVSVMASHGISLGCDAIANRLEHTVFSRIRHLLLLPFSIPSSLIFYGLSRLLDDADRQDAIGWAAVCRTKS